MAFLPAIIKIINALGVRVDRPRADGTYQPIVLGLDSTISASCDLLDDGTTLVRIGATGTGTGAGHFTASSAAVMAGIATAQMGDTCFLLDTQNTWTFCAPSSFPLSANVVNGIGGQWVFDVDTITGIEYLSGGIKVVYLPNFPTDAVIQATYVQRIGQTGTLWVDPPTSTGFTIHSTSDTDGSAVAWHAT
jgi:hypothetical protein